MVELFTQESAASFLVLVDYRDRWFLNTANVQTNRSELAV